VARAAVEAVAHQVCDIVDVIEADGKPLTTLRADGGGTASDLLMQTQADLLGRRLEVADVAEVSALGAAQLGWSSLGHPANWAQTRSPSRSFEPGSTDRGGRREAWRAEMEWSRARSR
jgi:glycerol kinase